MDLSFRRLSWGNKRDWRRAILLFPIYLATAEIGQVLSFPHRDFTSFWPQSSILLTLFLLAPRISWFPHIVAIMGANLLSDAWLHGQNALASTSLSFANLLEAVAVYMVWRRLTNGDFDFDDWGSKTLRFFAAILIGCGIGAMLGTILSLFQMTDIGFWPMWRIWTVTDMIGIMIGVPFLVTWIEKPLSFRTMSVWKRLEGLALLSSVTWVSILAFTSSPASEIVLRFPFVLIPFLMWSAVRFELQGATLINVIIAAVSIFGTTMGLGPFWAQDFMLPNQVLLLEIFIAINTFTALFTAFNVRRNRVAAEELFRAKQAAEEANEQKSRFLANISHELRTPLGAIMGFAEMIARQPRSEKVDEQAQVIWRNGKQLLRLIDDLLDLTKVESGRLEVEKTPVSLPDLILEVEGLLSPKAKAKGLILAISSTGPIPSTIITDSLRLRQILINMVGNAIKFTMNGRVDIIIDWHPATEGLSGLAVLVKDTGLGISAEQAEKLFTPFTQGDVGTARQFGGSGLGLSLSRHLARSLDGDLVLASSTFQQGSTFRLDLPVRTEGHVLSSWAEYSQQQRNLGSRIGNMESSDVNLEGRHILVVDDAQEIQQIIGYYLQNAAANVDFADNGHDGVQKAMASTYDVVLMDIEMPGLDGYSATKWLRENGYHRPIIALTAHAMKGEVEKCIEAGFSSYLAKPVGGVDLLRAIRRELDDETSPPWRPAQAPIINPHSPMAPDLQS